MYIVRGCYLKLCIGIICPLQRRIYKCAAYRLNQIAAYAIFILTNLKTVIGHNTMEPWPYKTDFERQKQILFERYMRLRRNDVYDSGNERYQWVEVAAKNRYRPEVKVNNWVEEQRDVDYLKHRRPLAGDFDYAYETEYLTRYGDVAGRRITPSGREPKVFPGHQPELDLPPLKRVYNSFETTSRVAYQDPDLVTDVKKESPCIYCKINAGHFGR